LFLIELFEDKSYEYLGIEHEGLRGTEKKAFITPAAGGDGVRKLQQ